jgi:hypothetical protein
VDRARLTERGVAGGDREVAGHADLLAAGDAQAVDPADDRLVAQQDRRHHVVEQTHVLEVLVRPAGVVGGVLGGVAAGAEGALAGAGENHGDGRPVGARAAEGEDHLLDRFGRVAVELAGLSSEIQTWWRPATAAPSRPRTGRFS